MAEKRDDSMGAPSPGGGGNPRRRNAQNGGGRVEAPGSHQRRQRERRQRLDEREKDAFQHFMDLLEQYGFKGNREIAREVRNMIVNGESSWEQIQLGLMDTKAWQRRFKGNELRRKAGQNVLSVAEYLAYENQASELMKAAGLPKGFYDGPEDFAQFIGNSVSVNELNERIGMASDLLNRYDPAIKSELKKRGLTEGEMLAAFLDADRAAPILKRRYQSTLIGAAADRAGVDADTRFADRLASMGVTEDEAAQGYGTVAAITDDLTQLADIYGGDYGQRDAEREVFMNSADARKKREKLSAAEQANFGGSSGVGGGSLTRSSAGSF